MYIRVRHATTYTYKDPARSVIQVLRLTPRNYEGQHVGSWRIEVDMDCRLYQSEDAFGNIVHTFSAEGPVEKMTVLVEGDVETFDMAGVVRGASERFPSELYLRETDLTVASDGIRKFAHEVAGSGDIPLDTLHALLDAIPAYMTFDTEASGTGTTAAESFSSKRGVCQDFAHLFIACARTLDIPARYVGGYFMRDDGGEQTAGHAWAEAYVEGLGWVGFDPTHAVCPGESYIRIASGLDFLGASPVRGARHGGSEEEMTVALRVANMQSQSQRQS